MFRFRPELMVLTIAVLLLSGALGMWWPLLVDAIKHAHPETMYDLLCFAGTAVLICVAGGVRRRLPSYGGAPPMRDLVRILVPYVVVALFAVANVWGLSALLDFVHPRQTGWDFVRQVARGLNLGVITFCLYQVTFIIVDFRRDVAWDRRVHPHQYQ